MKYIALLRGINVGGNNKISMQELVRCFEALSFRNVVTYINSGNIIFETLESDKTLLIQQCEKAILATFGFAVTCSIVSADELKDAVAHAPAWWGLGDEDKHNAIFVIPPASTRTIMDEVGAAKPEYEKVASYGPIIFWTAPFKTFGRTAYSKIARKPAYQFVTIRNANTTKKLVELIK